MATGDWYAKTQKLYADKPEGLATFQRTYRELQTLGRGGYMDLYPEVFREFAPVTPSFPSWEERRIKDLSGLLSDYRGPEAGHIRWLIKNRIKELEWKLARQRGIKSIRGRDPEFAPPPVPDWMKPYIETGMPYEGVSPEQRGGGRTLGKREEDKGIGQLRPLGAQEELTPDQMAQMAGYQAWGKAGAPTRFSEDALRSMSDWQRHWQPYTRLSQSLFPKQAKLGKGWRTASQR